MLAGLHAAGHQPGCLACEAGFLAVRDAKMFAPVCLRHPDEQPLRIPHCVNHRLESNGMLNCQICTSGYRRTAFGVRCVVGAGSDIPEDEESSRPAGDRLLAGSDPAVSSLLQNCMHHNNQGFCDHCLDGFILIRMQNEVRVCVQNPAAVELCAQFDSGLARMNVLSCLRCKGAAEIEKLQTPKSICLEMKMPKNCSVGSFKQLVRFSSRRCTRCSTLYYLQRETGTCHIRFAYQQRCSVFNPYADSCNVCSDNFYQSSETDNICLELPSGVRGCEVYDSPQKCSKCQKHYFLSNGLCELVNQILFCEYYSDANTCSSCVANFLIQNNTCVKAVATMCATYQSVQAC